MLKLIRYIFARKQLIDLNTAYVAKLDEAIDLARQELAALDAFAAKVAADKHEAKCKRMAAMGYAWNGAAFVDVTK